MSIHSRNDAVILEFGLHKPAFRIVVNTPTSHGSIGLTTGLDPAMTLGCGGFGGNITSDNISPRHLLNIKRLAWGIREAGEPSPLVGTSAPPGTSQPRSVAGGMAVAGPATAAAPLPKAPAKPSPEPVSAATLSSRIDHFLASRGMARPGSGASVAATPSPTALAPSSSSPPPATPVPFVCEDDVRAAVREGRTILVGERTIITPAARDAGESAKVFTWEGWRL
jgi:acetaldehyde dehydrogenase (acetylating)